MKKSIRQFFPCLNLIFFKLGHFGHFLRYLIPYHVTFMLTLLLGNFVEHYILNSLERHLFLVWLSSPLSLV
jgi:hypothetical protein